MCDPIKEAENLFKGVGDAITGTFNWVIDKVIDPVISTVNSVVQSALDNPVKTIAQIAAVATGNAWALPLIDGADVAAKGGNLEDVLKATAIAYVSQKVGSYVGGAANTAVAKATDSALAGQIVGSGTGAAAVAVVSGQDPLKAFISGGVGAATGAVLGKVDVATGGNFSKLPVTAQAAIQSAITAQITNNPNPTAAIMGGIISASGIVTDAIKSFDPDGTKLDNTQRAILTDVLMGTATAALSGGKASTVIQAAMIKAGSKALGDMATDTFKKATAATSTAYDNASAVAKKVDANEKAQTTSANQYNNVVSEYQGKLTEQTKLKTAYENAIAAHNANPSQTTANAANAAITAYNSSVTTLDQEYKNTYKPLLDKHGGELNALTQTHNVLVGEYGEANKEVATKVDAVSGQLGSIYAASDKAFVEVMDSKFNADQYKALNGLTADQDPYQHFLTKGQFDKLPTNDEAAQPIVATERTRLVTAVLEQIGVTSATADPASVAKILDYVDANYGNNVAALKGASIRDIVNGNAEPLNQLVNNQRNGVFTTEITYYGGWREPTDFTLPAGTKLASVKSLTAGTAAKIYDKQGNPVWVENNPATAVTSWDSTYGTGGTLPEVIVTATRLTPEELILSLAEAGGEEVEAGVVSQAMINAAKTVVDWAKQSGSSTLINSAANVFKAGGGFLESINGVSVLMGAAPKTTALGKFANTLNNLGKASNTEEYQAAIKNIQSIIGEAKGVGGTLKAIYGAFESAPLQFVAEFVGVEGIQEIGPLLIGGVVTTGAKGAALALKYGQAIAAKMGTTAGMTTSIMGSIVESAGGAATSAYDETYKVALKAGKTPAEADKIAMEVAQRQALIAGGVTAVTMGLGGAALEKALLGKTGTRGLGSALQTLGDAAKTGAKIAIKEGVSEAGGGGITQGALEVNLYKLDPTRDSAKEITQAAAFGFIAGGPIAGGAFAASRTGDVISNVMQGNPLVANILETNKSNPAAAVAALANLGITNKVIQSNLMNTIDNGNYNSSAEVAVELSKRGDYVYSDADVTALTGQGTDATLVNRAEAYVDPKVFDIEEVKAAAKAEGYTITDEEAARIAGQKDEAAAAVEAKAEFDPKAFSIEEVKAAAKAEGYTITDEEAARIASSTNEVAATAAAKTEFDSKVFSIDEVKAAAAAEGYTLTDEEAARMAGQKDEIAATAAAKTEFDSKVVNAQEVIDAYVALGLSKPTQDDVNKLVGQYNESELAAKATDSLPTARYNSLVKQLEDLGSGASPADIKAIQEKIDDLQKTSTGAIDDAKKALVEKIDANEKAGLTRDEATQKAITDLATEQGTTKADILKQIGATEETLAKKVDDALLANKTAIDNTEKTLTKKIDDNEKAGLTRDEATKKGIADLATELGVTKADLLKQIGATELELKNGITKAKQDTLDIAAAYEKAGIARDQALDLAIKDVSKTLGQATQQAKQSDLDAMIKLLETQGGYDPQYDYNGDKIIDQKDRLAIETYLKTQQPDYKPDPNDPFNYDPATGTKWAPTGVYKAVADEAAATRQAQANEAEQTRQRADALAKTSAAQALKTQRMGNVNSLMGMLGQAGGTGGDAGGQQTTVKAADPAKIGYIYDFNSIFANPAQEKMFVSPYAKGGLVDDSEDANDELLKILKG